MKKLLSEAFGLKCVAYDFRLEGTEIGALRMSLEVSLEMSFEEGKRGQLPDLSGELTKVFSVVDYSHKFSSYAVVGVAPVPLVCLTLHARNYSAAADIIDGLTTAVKEAGKLKGITYDPK